MVDGENLLEPLLGNPILDGTLRTADVLNGCGHQCATCLADAVLPSKMFSFSSLKKLFGDSRFIKMLQPDSLRFGSSGDILDHPQGVEITQLALDATASKSEERMSEEGEPFKIKIFTNYRPKLEESLDELIELAKKYEERLDLCVSLPLNKKDTVNDHFDEYAKERVGVFGKGDEEEDGSVFWDLGRGGMKNVCIQDVRHPRLLFTTGRVMPEEALKGKVEKYDMVENDRETSFADRGLVKTYFNPEALWLMVYDTPYESHTGRSFTPITPHNLDYLSQLPYHPDFPTPPNWPGGKGQEKDWREAERLQKQARRGHKPMKAVTEVS